MDIRTSGSCTIISYLDHITIVYHLPSAGAVHLTADLTRHNGTGARLLHPQHTGGVRSMVRGGDGIDCHTTPTRTERYGTAAQ